MHTDPCSSLPPTSSLSRQASSPTPRPHFFVICDMSDQLASSRFEALFKEALHDYERHTGIPLVKHPLAEQFQNCQSVDSVTTLLQEQTRAFSDFRGSNRIMKSLKSLVSALSRVSAVAALGHNIGLVRPRLLIGVPPDARSIVVPACACDTCWPRYPTLGMCPCFYLCMSSVSL